MAFDLNELQNQYKTLFEANNGDVKIEARDGEINVHSKIISVYPSFAKILDSNVEEGKQKSIDMKKYALEPIKDFFAYIYYKKVYNIGPPTYAEIFEVLEMATIYEIKPFADSLLSDILDTMITEDGWDNIITVIVYSKKYLLTDEQKAVINKEWNETLNTETKNNLTKTIQNIYKIFRKHDGDGCKIDTFCKEILDGLCDMNQEEQHKSVLVKLHRFNGSYYICLANYDELEMTYKDINALFVHGRKTTKFQHCSQGNGHSCNSIINIDEQKIVKREDTEKGEEYEIFYYRYEF